MGGTRTFLGHGGGDSPIDRTYVRMSSPSSRPSRAVTWVTGIGPDGEPREVYLHHVVDNDETWGRDGAQAVVWQTAINPVIALELLATGA